MTDPVFKTVLAAWSFIFGAVVASFVNVVAWRVPRGESVVLPASHCPKCGAFLKWYHNIPVFSWLFLRGRCAFCKKKVSARYILVELLGGFLFLALFLKYSFAAPVLWAWVSLLMIGSLVDFDHCLLPDFVTVGGAVWGLAVSVAVFCASIFWPSVAEAMPFVPSPAMSFLGLAAGAGILWTVGFVGAKIAKREAMGAGDVLLLGAVGAVSGPVAAVFTLVVSALAGSVAGLAWLAFSKAARVRWRMIPYGPYISLGAVLWLFIGEESVAAYLRFMGLEG